MPQGALSEMLREKTIGGKEDEGVSKALAVALVLVVIAFLKLGAVQSYKIIQNLRLKPYECHFGSAYDGCPFGTYLN